MRKRAFIPMLVLGSLCLTGCFDDTKGSKEWASPDLFFSQATYPDGIRITSSMFEDNYHWIRDNDFYIRDCILEAGYFSSIFKRDAKTNRYFSYYFLRSNATSGPNYCQLLVYADGLVVIDYKSSLSPHYYFYYEIDSSKAYDLNLMVEEKIEFEYNRQQLTSASTSFLS